MEKKWIAAAGTLAAACVLGFVVLKALPADSLRTPTENDPASQARMADSQNGQTPEAAAYGLPEDASEDSAAPASMDDTSEADPSMEGPAAEQTAPSSLRVTGTIAEISDDQILLKNEEEGAAYPEILLNLTEDTLILSAADCSEKALSDFAVGDTVYADVSPVMTRSLPPMTNAFTLFCEIPEDTAVPAYGTITDVSADEDGNLRVFHRSGSDPEPHPGRPRPFSGRDGNPFRSRADGRRHDPGALLHHDHEHPRPDHAR